MKFLIKPLISQVLSCLSNAICSMDDVLVLRKTHNNHLDVLEKVFTALEDAGVKIHNAHLEILGT